MNRILIPFALCLTALAVMAKPASSNKSLSPRQRLIIAAAKADEQGMPRFNGPSAIGIHPGMPLVQTIAVSGSRPMTYSAKNLPAGLHLDPHTGILTGALAKPGQFVFTVLAQNSQGMTGRKMRIISGNTLAETPPMGWNSYDAFGDSVTEAETLANARWMQAHLLPYGWDTIVIDFRWYDPKPTGNDRLLNKTRTGAKLAADEYGRLLPAVDRFPSATNGVGFKPLADKLHAMGLKFGIHVMRGIPRQAVLADTKILGGKYTAAEAADTNDKCAWCPDMFGVRDNAAGQAWYDSCAKLWASWGVDYIKVDDLSVPYHAAEIRMIHRALMQVNHAIIFSTSPGPTSTAHGGDIMAYANLWRISGDFWDRWSKLNHQFDLLAEWQGAAGPGHWPDADMIPLGHIAIRSKMGGNPHMTHFTRDEQLTLMSLWALAPSPLMLGMNLPDNDAWTTALLTDPDVLAVDQDWPVLHSHRLFIPGQPEEIWVRLMHDGSQVVGLFNRTDKPIKLNLAWSVLGYSRPPAVRDLWLQRNYEKSPKFTAELPIHGCYLLRLSR